MVKKWWPGDIKARNGADIGCRYITEMDYDALAARLDEVAAIAHDGGLRSMSEADALTAIRRLTLPYWNKAGSAAERTARVPYSASHRENERA